jgi:hypothetical protein
MDIPCFPRWSERSVESNSAVSGACWSGAPGCVSGSMVGMTAGPSLVGWMIIFNVKQLKGGIVWVAADSCCLGDNRSVLSGFQP